MDPIKKYYLLNKYIVLSFLFLAFSKPLFWSFFHWLGGFNQSTFPIYHCYMWFSFIVEISSIRSYIYCYRFFYGKTVNNLAEQQMAFFCFWSLFFTFVMSFEIFGTFSQEPYLILYKNTVFRVLRKSLIFFFLFLCVCLLFIHEQQIKKVLKLSEFKIYFLGYLVGFSILNLVFDFGNYFIFNSKNHLGFMSLYQLLIAPPKFN